MFPKRNNRRVRVSFVSVEQGLGLPDILGPGFVLPTVVHHGVRVHPDILRGQSTGAAGHPQTAVQAEETKTGQRAVVGGSAQPVGHVANDEFHHASAAGVHRYGRVQHAAVRNPFAAGHAGQHHAAGDSVRLCERREHQRREQGRRQGHAEGVHHAR